MTVVIPTPTLFTDPIVDYYKALLILQYASLPNALGTIDALIKVLLQKSIIQQVQDAFNIDSALGAQLDILGTYRGQNRNAFGLVPASYWALPEYSDPNAGTYFGLAEYNDPTPTWNTLQYNDVNATAYTLSDSQMRRLIKLRAALDSNDMGLGDLDALLFSFFGTYVNLVDLEDMSIIYQHVATDPDPDTLFDVASLTNALPHPAGVSFSVVEV